MSILGQQVVDDPLRSYELEVLPLIAQLSITNMVAHLGFNQVAARSPSGHLRVSLSPADYSLVDKYLARPNYMSSGVFAMQVTRTVSLQTRLPLKDPKVEASQAGMVFSLSFHSSKLMSQI